VLPKLVASNTFTFLKRGIAVFTLTAWLLGQTPAPQPPGPAPDPARPPLTPVRSSEDFGFLRDPSKRTDFWDPVKFIPIGSSGKSYLTLGFEYRAEYEWYNNANWGSGAQDGGGYALQRVMPLLDLHIGDHFRAFTQFKYDTVDGRRGGPRPVIDADRGDVHEAFFEVSTNLHKEKRLTLRVGRQELVFGSGRLVDDNEGVNVKSSFDGARLFADTGTVQVSLFATRPAESNTGPFDDSPNHRQSFWGAYGTAPAFAMKRAKFDLYYFGLDTKRTRYQRGAGRETRHSVGVRAFNRADGAPPETGWTYNWEGVWQWGTFAGAPIRAWTWATDTGYTWAEVRFQPHIAVRADSASGDHNPAGKGNFSTFNPLFPRGAYFAPKLVLAGPNNFYDVRPLVQFALRKNVTGQLDASWFWRESIHDGLYGIGGQLLRPGSMSRARYIGAQADLEIRWALDPHLTLVYNFGGFRAGQFLRETPPGANVVLVNIGLTYKF